MRSRSTKSIIESVGDPDPAGPQEPLPDAAKVSYHSLAATPRLEDF